MSRARLEALVAAAKFSKPEINHWVSELMRPVISFEVSQGTAAAGQSKIGGRPDLPKGFEWPGDKAFIAQVNFSQVHPFDEATADYLGCALPEAGMLSIFASIDESELLDAFDAMAVFCHPADEPLVTTELPDSIDETEGRFEERPLTLGISYELIGPATGCWRPQGSKPHDFHYSPFDRWDRELFRKLNIEAGMLPTTIGFMAGVGCFYDPNLRKPFRASKDIEAVCLDGGAVHRSSGTTSIYAGGIFHVYGTMEAVKQGAFTALFEV